nr:His-Xaa-Ser system radical SAM maturase HxsC [Paradevosia shaoguanensis]
MTLRSSIDGIREDVVLRINLPEAAGPDDGIIETTDEGIIVRHGNATISIHGIEPTEMAGDVLFVQPNRGVVQRLIRKNSPHNTFLVTERCDQLCVMCSQPPKKTHVDMFGHFSVAATLAPENAVIGISGGEPTLYKDDLFGFLKLVGGIRPDLRFHILSNAQHFVSDDATFLGSEIGRRVMWGVPLYSDQPATHDLLVGKTGAFDLLMDGLAILSQSGAHVELRTVLMTTNAQHLPSLANFIASHVPFADPWAIMQLENIGFARNRWRSLFYDHSEEFGAVAEAIDLSRAHGIPVRLYNFPLCTVPTTYRRFAPSTISDWKRRYEARCDGCIGRRQCGGFFEWHPDAMSYRRLGL